MILFLLLALMILATVYVEDLMGRMHHPNDDTKPPLSSSEIDDILHPSESIDPTDTTPTLDATDVTWNTDPLDTLGGEHVINILLIGQDARNYQTARQRSDAMILCTLNKETKTLTMTSFMRDLYVQIPGHGASRLNASYSIGGMKLLDECLKLNFGVEIDGNIEIDFTGFMDVIELLGGIDMELTQAEADYLNRRGNWDLEDNAGEWDLKEGVNHLNGSQALAYSRVRDIGDDFGRTERQRKVLTKILEMAKGLNLMELNKLLYTMVDMITTDLSNAQITNLVLEGFNMLSDLQIVTQRIPVWGAYENRVINGMQILYPDLEKNRELLAEAMKKN